MDSHKTFSQKNYKKVKIQLKYAPWKVDFIDVSPG